MKKQKISATSSANLPQKVEELRETSDYQENAATSAQDLIARKKAEEELQKLEMAIHNAQEVFFMTDKEGIITYINPEFTKLYGYTSEEVVGKTTPRILNSGLYKKEDSKPFWDALLNKQTIRKTEYFNKCKDGKLIEIEGSANPILNKEGVLIGFLGVQRGITERKRSEFEQLVMYEITRGVTTTSNLNELLKLIHQSLGKVLYADNCFVALFNQKTGLFSFPYWVDKFDPIPEPDAMLKSWTAYVFRTGKPILFSQELFRKLKEQNEVTLLGSPSPSWIGIPLQTSARTIGVLVLQHYEKEHVYSKRDVQFLDSVGSQIAMAVERKQAEEELRESENKLNVILQSTADGILAIDSNGKVVKSNKRFADLWRIPQVLIDSGDDNALIGFILDQLINPGEFILKVQKLYRSSDEDLDNLHFKDGRIFERFSAPLIMADSSIGRVWSFRDITERKLAEQNIQKRNEELSKANAEKDKFFTIIAHDLRAPFGGFLGLTQIMAQELPNLTMAQVHEIAMNMSKSATNLYRLLENLLEWSQIQKGSIPFNPTAIQLRSLVDESLALVLDTSKSKKIETSCDIAEDITVFADSPILQSVLRNLVSNALKFTRKGGKVRVSAKTTFENTVEIAVQDTGIGMSQTMVDNLFRIDVQTKRKGTEGEPSTGLGLLLCKEFVEKHGGTIWAESEVGKGSIFFFSIQKAK